MLEADTIRKFIEGDLAAFEAIYCAYSPKATWFAVKYVCSEEVAKDIVHDVFLSIWDSRKNLNPDYPVEPYIMTSVRNRCLNYLRDNISKNKASDTLQKRILRLKYESLQHTDGPAFDAVLATNLRDKMYRSLEKMPEKTREAFVLNRFNNMSYKQIAELHGVSEKNIEYRIKRALRQLRLDLSEFFKNK